MLQMAAVSGHKNQALCSKHHQHIHHPLYYHAAVRCPVPFVADLLIRPAPLAVYTAMDPADPKT
jgi:hypothetical protein